MEANSLSVEGRIVQAAIECIERYGIQGATNRKIAALAGVNNAAINYYFRSKEVLVERCMRVTLDNAFDWEDIANLPGRTARERCAAIFNDLIQGGINYPGLTRSHFFDLISQGNYQSLAVEKLNEFVENLAKDLDQKGAGLEANELRLACVQITSAAMMVILAPQLFAPFGFDLRDPATRHSFVNRLVDRLL
ncbi:MAG: TetR/AcrR family transcriptional regulator [Anaerolineaceae bacterium]